MNKSAPDTARITWLASYPKSGNTWARTFLTNYLREASEEADINDLYGGPIASSRLMFDRAAGISAAWLLPREIDALRPAVYRYVAAAAARPLFFKVHDAWRCTDRGEPLFPIQVTRATVYIVRNPLDVAVSASHHYGQSSEATVKQLCQDTFTLSKAKRGVPGAQLPQFVGDWSGHARSWLHESGLPVHVMRYEDMVVDARKAFGCMLAAAGIEVDAARLAAAVDASSFLKLQQQETRSGFRERRAYATAPFFRRGRVGSWREELAPNLVRQLIHAHGEMMHELGYIDEQHRPFELPTVSISERVT